MQSSRYAGFYPRMLAHNIDLVLLLPLFYGLGTFISANILLLISCWGLYTSYHIVFEVSGWHGTPGKKFQGITIASDIGQSLRISQIIWRNLAKIISVLLLFAGIVLIAVDKRNRGLHDRLAGTVVIFS